MKHSLYILPHVAREMRREYAERWARLRQALRQLKGNYIASAVVRRELRQIESVWKDMHPCFNP